MNDLGATVAFSPLLPWWALSAFAAAAAALILAGLYLKARGILFRALAAALLLAVLANPSVVVENRKPLTDIAVVVVDESPSQELDRRRELNARTLAAVREKLRALGNLEVRVVRVGLDRAEDGTLFSDRSSAHSPTCRASAWPASSPSPMARFTMRPVENRRPGTSARSIFC